MPVQTQAAVQYPACKHNDVVTLTSPSHVTFREADVDENFVAPRTLDAVADGLMKLFERHDVNTNQVQAFLEAYAPDPKEWSQFAAFDEFKYTRNLIAEGNGKFNLILLCWNKNQSSPIHDHANSHCFMKIMKGRLTETLYDWPSADQSQDSKPMTPSRQINLKENSVAYINDSIGLHRVSNESVDDVAVSLHVYSPPIQMCQSFDERSGGKRRCHVTFHTKYGERVRYDRTAQVNP